MEKGKKSEKIEIAKSAIKMGLSNGKIQILTGLTSEEINNLK